MKTAGIVILVIGILSTIGGIMQTIALNKPNFAGLTFVVLGAFLISQANKKKEEEEKKRKWSDEDSLI